MYLRIKQASRATVTLQFAKSKSALINWAGISHLELAATHMLARLTQHYLKGAMITAVPLWTDAKIVLCWLNKPPSSCQPFVANRCSAIHESVPKVHWHYIKLKQNPPDIVSRGCHANYSLDSTLW